MKNYHLHWPTPDIIRGTVTAGLWLMAASKVRQESLRTFV